MHKPIPKFLYCKNVVVINLFILLWLHSIIVSPNYITITMGVCAVVNFTNAVVKFANVAFRFT